MRDDLRIMPSRGLTDIELVLELVGEAYNFEDLGEFRTGVIEVLNRVVPSDRIAYNEIAPGEALAVMIPEHEYGLMPRFAALSHENPLIERIRRTGDGRPYRISDVVDQATFHATALYQEFYRPMKIETQVAFSLPSRPQLLVGIALTRERDDFSDREVQLLALARPHLMQAYRNAELRGARIATLVALEAGLDTLGRHVVVVDTHGGMEFATDGARRLLGDAIQARGRLPAQLQAWLSERRGRRVAAEPYVLRTDEGNALVRLLPDTSQDRRRVLLLEAAPGELTVAALRGLGLTPRQTETLRLIALGRSAAQVAAELGIARRTVDKHLQQIYARLGTPSRVQAAATAWAAVGLEQPADGVR